MNSNINTIVRQLQEERDRLHTALQLKILREEKLETALRESLEIISNNVSHLTSDNTLKALVNLQKVLKN